jgi:hypothetical protein
MRELIESLSWTSGFLLVAVISAVIALFTGRLQATALRWGAIVVTPSTVSYCLYWSPVWFGADSSEYSAWSGVFVIPWSAMGILASVAVVIAVRQQRKAKNVRHG